MLYLTAVRHGETEWNRVGRLQGWLDSPLTPAGVAQAEGIAASLRGETFDALVSSDLGRALRSAEIMGGALGLPVAATYEEFREGNFGVLSGQLRAELGEFHPAYFRADGSRIAEDVRAVEGAESQRDIAARIARGLRLLCERYDGQRVLLSTHAGVIHGIRRIVYGIEREATSNISNSAAERFDVELRMLPS